MDNVSFLKIRKLQYQDAKLDILFNSTHLVLTASYASEVESLCVVDANNQ